MKNFIENKLKVSVGFFILWFIWAVLFLIYISLLLIGNVVIDIPYFGVVIRTVLHASPFVVIFLCYLWCGVFNSISECEDTLEVFEDGVIVVTLYSNKGSTAIRYTIEEIEKYKIKSKSIKIWGIIKFEEYLDGVLITKRKKKKVKLSSELPIIKELINIVECDDSIEEIYEEEEDIDDEQ